MFSAASGQLGHWPGLDIAHILDSASYHTMQDNLDRLRPGIMQVSMRNQSYLLHHHGQAICQHLKYHVPKTRLTVPGAYVKVHMSAYSA